MKNIKKKLSSKSGASMLLALVFLLFCLLVGGSVLSAASANGSRAARQKEDQQAYLSQRSATLLLADMLRSGDDSAMQLTIKDVTSESGRSITFMAHGDGPKSSIQEMLYEQAIAEYLEPLEGKEGIGKNFLNMGSSYSFSTAAPMSGTISIDLQIGTNSVEKIMAWYNSSDDGFSITYAEPKAEASPAEESGTDPVQHSYVTLNMKCYRSSNSDKPVIVNDIKTITTIIRWDDPVIEKGGA